MSVGFIKSLGVHSNTPDVVDIPIYTDDRGYVYCARDCMDLDEIKRTYIVENFNKGMVRAWHGHKAARTFMHVLSGSVKLAAMKMDDESNVFTAVLTGRKPQLFYVPAGYYNGAMSLTDGTKILVYSTLNFNDVKKDDFREKHTVRGDLWEVINR